MNVLIVGSGAREHALAWKAAQSPRLSRLFVAPGNAGTDSAIPAPPSSVFRPPSNIPIRAGDSAALVAFAREQRIDLVIVGPEAPLAAGLADDLRAAGVNVFGPSRAAAAIESSKAFAKAFMRRHGIPSARYAAFRDFYDAVGHLLAVPYPVVIKASGLAAGKGVIVPGCADEAEAALRRIMLDREFGAAGDEVVVEERLEGEEVSLLCFTDGQHIRVMPPAQDHKRLLDGDRGPNTGGMGAYAPTPVISPAQVAACAQSILQRAVDGLRAEGRPFAGVLYAGLMLTRDGPQVLEFNCRAGDPETQALMPLLDADLLDVCEACADGRLGECDVRWKPGAAACVVLASAGYPDHPVTGQPIHGLDAPIADALIFHAGTRRAGDQVVTDGGRVLSVVGLAADAAAERTPTDNIARAVVCAYAAVEAISFDGMQYRRDIAQRAAAGAR